MQLNKKKKKRKPADALFRFLLIKKQVGESAVSVHCNLCRWWNKSSYTQIFLFLSLMRCFGPQILFYAI